jgi:uncharacterized protein (TIGR00369 family)
MSLKTHPIIERYNAWNAFGRLLGMDFEIPGPGQVVYTMTITEELLATPFAAHGGSISALMDATLGVACLSQVCEEGRIVSTVSLTIQYQSPALPGDVLTAKGKVTKTGKRLLFAEGMIENQKGEIVATAMATMNAYPVEKMEQ